MRSSLFTSMCWMPLTVSGAMGPLFLLLELGKLRGQVLLKSLARALPRLMNLFVVCEQVVRLDARALEELERVLQAVVVSVEDLLDPTEVDETLRAHHARHVRAEHDLLGVARNVAVDDGVLLCMETAAVADSCIAVAVAVVLAAGDVAIVTDSEHLARVGRHDRAAHLKPRAGRALRHHLGEVHVDLMERRTGHQRTPLLSRASRSTSRA